MDYQLTEHGSKRISKRIGVNKKGQDRLIQKVLERGIARSQCKGRLRKWIDEVRNDRRKCDYIVYGEYLYVFGTSWQRDRTLLITTFHIPASITKNMKKQIEAARK